MSATDYQRGYQAGYHAGIRRKGEPPPPPDDAPTCPVCRFKGNGRHRCETGWVSR